MSENPERFGESAGLVDMDEFPKWIIYEDSNYLALDKPGWLVCHPSGCRRGKKPRKRLQSAKGGIRKGGCKEKVPRISRRIFGRNSDRLATTGRRQTFDSSDKDVLRDAKALRKKRVHNIPPDFTFQQPRGRFHPLRSGAFDGKETPDTRPRAMARAQRCGRQTIRPRRNPLSRFRRKGLYGGDVVCTHLRWISARPSRS